MKNNIYLFIIIFQLTLAGPAVATDYAQSATSSSEFINNPEKLAEYWRERKLEQEKNQRNTEALCKKKGLTEQYYQECILEKMPGTRNQVAVSETLDYCGNKAPCDLPKKKRSGFFGVTTANECFEKYGKRSSLKSAAYYIQSACYDLYEDK